MGKSINNKTKFFVVVVLHHHIFRIEFSDLLKILTFFSSFLFGSFFLLFLSSFEYSKVNISFQDTFLQ